MTASDAAVHRWSDLRLEKVTEMVSRKVIAGDRQTLIQAYLKRGAQIPRHAHAADRLVYVLQGALRCRVEAREIAVREGEVLHVPAGVRHQAEAVDDTFALVALAAAPPGPAAGSAASGSDRASRGRARPRTRRTAGGGVPSSTAGSDA